MRINCNRALFATSFTHTDEGRFKIRPFDFDSTKISHGIKKGMKIADINGASLEVYLLIFRIGFFEYFMMYK